MLFEEYKHFLKKNKIVLLSYIFVPSYIYFNPTNICGFMYLSYFIFSLFLFIVLYQVHISNAFTKYICKYNYEIYLVHHRIYILLLPALLTPKSNGYQILIASVFMVFLTFLLSETLQKASNYTIEKGGIVIDLIKKKCFLKERMVCQK